MGIGEKQPQEYLIHCKPLDRDRMRQQHGGGGVQEGWREAGARKAAENSNACSPRSFRKHQEPPPPSYLQSLHAPAANQGLQLGVDGAEAMQAVEGDTSELDRERERGRKG